MIFSIQYKFIIPLFGIQHFFISIYSRCRYRFTAHIHLYYPTLCVHCSRALVFVSMSLDFGFVVVIGELTCPRIELMQRDLQCLKDLAGHPKTMRVSENIAAVRALIEKSPSHSARKHASVLRISK